MVAFEEFAFSLRKICHFRRSFCFPKILFSEREFFFKKQFVILDGIFS